MQEEAPILHVVMPVRRALTACHVALTLPLSVALLGFAMSTFLRYHRTGYGPGSVAMPWSLLSIGAVGCVMLYSALTCIKHGFNQGRETTVRADHLASISKMSWTFGIALLSQVALASLYMLAVSEKWDVGTKADPSGTIVVIHDYVQANSKLVISCVATLLAVECMALAVMVWTRSVVQGALSAAAAAEQAALEDIARRAYEPVSASAWNSRLREKYGVDPSEEDHAGNVGDAGNVGNVGDEELGRPLLEEIND